MKKGFTTIETIAGLAIFSVIVIAFFLALTLALRLQINAKHITIATDEAEKTIEMQRTKKFSDLTNGSTVTSLSNLPGGQETLTISDVGTTLKKISVTVSWNIGPTNNSVNLETLATQGGLNDLNQ